MLAALWARLASENPPETLTVHRLAFERYAAALTPLTGTLSTTGAREVLTRAFAALAQLLPALERASHLLRQLSLMSATEIDQPDYDARLQAYRWLIECRRLLPGCFLFAKGSLLQTKLLLRLLLWSRQHACSCLELWC